MATTDDLTLRMRAQGARQASRDVDRASKSVRGLNKQSGVAFRSITKLGGGLRAVGSGAAAFGIAGVAMAGIIGKQSVTAASDLNEVISKTRVIFKESQGGILRWSRTTADGLGLSQEQALAAASGMGNLLVPMGVARKTAAGMSKRMVTLAGDMASFNNASPEETLGALQAAFIGEYDPVQRFGAAITAARVESEAMRKTHKKSKDDLTAAEKAQAAYTLILKDTKDQQGDFGRTSDGLANSQRRLAAVWEDLKAQMGTPLLDIVRQGIGRLIKPLQHVTNVARTVFSDSSLGWEQRFRILGASIRHWFGPIANDMVAALRAAHLDQKLNALIKWSSPQVAAGFRYVAPMAASAFIGGFKSAPAWARLLTVGFVLAKVAAMAGPLRAGGAAAGTTFGTAMGPAAWAVLGAYLLYEFGRAVQDWTGKPGEKPGAVGPKGHKVTVPSTQSSSGSSLTSDIVGRILGGKHHPATDPGPTSGNNPLGPDPIIELHSHTHLDGKEVAHSVRRHAVKDKATK